MSETEELYSVINFVERLSIVQKILSLGGNTRAYEGRGIFFLLLLLADLEDEQIE